ncbi:NAD(P)/FAD-dependent oxidoreductase [Dictyobacter aurantiacus]|uniref:Pyridine nucleotide-disulfide oxidoreductase n=1 Tax=Dictyobacter aurantiacus TaxID=1936993 RepID=A0A401ZSI5_9CHLR|nr:FAD-dependent oxidoreductase [Dictyobacter aurantiacus]GCE09837.1 pyridine nucleotide-disulfide oxidoreductase [Dictyobacter aurantiacus]
MVSREELKANFKKNGRIAIVGASLAGLRAVETLRREGFGGKLTVIGDEPYEPYDRPPLSKQVLSGWVKADHTTLPRLHNLDDVEWKLGVAATSLDIRNRQVKLADGQSVDFHRLLIATGVRARPWPKKEEATLDGVFVVRTCDDAQRLQERLDSKPRHVLVIGAGFTGSEIASGCRDRGLTVTVTERSAAPLIGALGGTIGSIAGELQRQHGVDLRCNTTVIALEGDAQRRLRRARLSDGTTLDVDTAIVALGSIRNTEWLRGSGLAAGQLGVACDAGCRAFDLNGIVTDDIFVAGDVARFPHPLYGYQLIALEHWGNALNQAQVAAHNMVNNEADRRPHISIPAFWSSQFGVNIKSVGLPPFATDVAIMQGSVEQHRFVAAYGHNGRTVAAVSVDHGRWLPYYEAQIASAAHFPPAAPAYDNPAPIHVMPANFPRTGVPSATPTIALTGHVPGELRATYLEPSPMTPEKAVTESPAEHKV